MALIDEVERRAELAAKIATLEERSIQSQKQLERIEATLLKHANDEESILRDINKALVDFCDTVEDKISEAITPIKEDFQKYKTILGVVGTIATGIGGLIISLHEHILRWLGLR